MAKRSGKGFSGLSDIDTGIDEVLNQSPDIQPNTSPNDKPKTSTNQKKSNNSKKKSKTTSSPKGASNSDSKTFLLLGIGIVLFLVFVAINLSSKNSHHNNNLDSKSSKVVEQVSGKSSDYSTTKKDIPQSDTYSYSKNKQFSCTEVQPSSYTSILNKDELCYCLAEKIRIRSAEKSYDRYSQSSINKFNRMIDNYNSKCNNKQYYQREWNKVNSYIESKRSEFEKEGESRFVNTTNSNNKSSSYYLSCKETKPTMFTTILNANQLCYCLAENKRLDGAKSVLNHYSQSDINRYNTMVNNYNLICKNKQYYKDDLTKAEKDVNARSYTLREEGKRRFQVTPATKSNTSYTSRQTPNYNYSATYDNKFSLTIKPTPSDARVQIMNIKPKYYDGIKLKKGKYDIKVSKRGYKTVRTWINLEKDQYYNVTLQKDWKNNLPAHGKLNYFGNGWECQRGYYKSGNQCIRTGR